MSRIQPAFRHVSRPIAHWTMGLLMAATVIAFTAGAIRDGTLLSQPNAWVGFVLIPLFGAAALWMVCRPALSLEYDRAAGMLQLRKRGLLGSSHHADISLKEVASVTVVESAGADTTSFHAEILTKNGAVHPISVEMNSRRPCEAIVLKVREAIS